MIEQPLESKPIQEVTITNVDAKYVRRVYWYLEHVLGCKVESLGPVQGHRVIFPPGTVEETYRGQSTPWTRRTKIRFPTGQRLSKYVAANLPKMTTYSTMLAFPTTVLEGPEPPE